MQEGPVPPHETPPSSDLQGLSEPDAFLYGAGDMGARVRGFDWAQTSLGPVSSWTAALRSALSICLGSPFPIALYWGPALTLIYNDAWSPILGKKHPSALGRTAPEVWPEIWDAIGPMFERVLSAGSGTYSEDALLEMNRHGYVEECYFNFTFTPVRNDAGIEGVFNAVIETTYRVISERRNDVLRKLADHVAGARSAVEACRLAAESLAEATKDVPFCELYLSSEDGGSVELAGRSGLRDGTESVLRAWPLEQAARSGRIEVVEDLADRFGFAPPGGAWPEASPAALIAPFKAAGHLRGFLILGANPRRAIDHEYVQFVERAASLLATAVANADAYQAEHKRAEGLAELDRAKSTFFSNISHEFRTPLTLMLGPVQDALASPEATLGGEDLRAVHRNALRLLKLVNALLDFSRIEAGGVVTTPEPTDIAALTRDLSSAFRSTIERAGLAFTVDCPAFSAPVLVDRDIWEKVVLNLLSNAFKFTHAGEISVRLRASNNEISLAVSDTGVGIAEHDLPSVFKRFHRVQGAGVRSHEGSGIGLALVAELVKLHGGQIAVQSQLGKGSTFSVSIPLQLAEAQPALPAESTRQAATFVSEVARWSSDEAPGDPYGSVHREPTRSAERILIVDDNADMREYVTRLLETQWQVDAVSDGVQALEHAKHTRPSLVITDVMLPLADGFEVLRGLRADSRTHHIPVIMLSARAGEESRVEGLRAGADDYLVKPFSANELLARVHAQLQNALSKQAMERERLRLRSLLSQVPAIVTFLRGPDLVFEYAHPRAVEMMGGRDVLGKPLLEAVPELAGREIPKLLRQVFETGQSIEGKERSVHHQVDRRRSTSYWNFVYLPVFGDDGRPEGVMTFDVEVTDQVAARAETRRARERLESAISAAEVGTWRVDLADMMASRDAQLNAILGLESRDSRTHMADFFARVHPEDRAATEEAWRAVIAGAQSSLNLECRVVRPDGQTRWTRLQGRVVDGDAPGQHCLTGAMIDITDRREAELRFREMADAAPSILWVTDQTGACTFLSKGWENFTGQSRAAALGFGWVDMVHPDDRALARERFFAARDAKQAFSIDYRVRRPDGSYRWTVDSGRPWTSAAGEFLGHVGAVFDITDRKELEQQALQANRTKDEFLAMLGHELRNPLSPIVTALQLIRLRGRDAPEVEVIERQVAHLVRLVDDLLDVSRIARGKIELKRERVELADVVARGVETASPLLEQRRQLLICSVPSEGVIVEVDGARFAQVVANLLTNASKYSDPGTKIEVTASIVSGEVTLKVSDQGIGIAPEMLSSVFTLFVQQPQSIDRSEGGLGLGLAIVRSIVELHGGSVEARSEGPGRGSQFEVRLPLAAGYEQAVGRLAHASAGQQKAPSERNGRRVLVVDDNEDAATLVAELLDALGYEVSVAHDGPSALELAPVFKPDVCLLDIGLPVMDGYELAGQLRALPSLPENLRIVALTGYGTQNDRRRAIKAGFNDHLVKPVDLNALKQVVAQTLP